MYTVITERTKFTKEEMKQRLNVQDLTCFVAYADQEYRFIHDSNSSLIYFKQSEWDVWVDVAKSIFSPISTGIVFDLLHDIVDLPKDSTVQVEIL